MVWRGLIIYGQYRQHYMMIHHHHHHHQHWHLYTHYFKACWHYYEYDIDEAISPLHRLMTTRLAATRRKACVCLCALLWRQGCLLWECRSGIYIYMGREDFTLASSISEGAAQHTYNIASTPFTQSFEKWERMHYATLLCICLSWYNNKTVSDLYPVSWRSMYCATLANFWYRWSVVASVKKKWDTSKLHESFRRLRSRYSKRCRCPVDAVTKAIPHVTHLYVYCIFIPSGWRAVSAWMRINDGDSVFLVAICLLIIFV